MSATTGFWRASAAADPLGTAEALLRWRDELVWAGWRGEAAGARLNSLFALTKLAPPGPADVASVAVEKLVDRDLGWSVTTVDDESSGLAGRLLHALKATRLTTPRSGIRANDVVVVEPSSLIDGAEVGAAWLAAEGTRLVVGREPLLDEVLARRGLPTLGQGHGATDDPALAVLPAVIVLAFDADHPGLAQRLLRLPQSPVQGHYRVRLLAALSDWPSTTSPAWLKALERADEKHTDAERGAARAFVSNIFDAKVEIDSRVDLVEAWARGRVGHSASSLAWAKVVEQCRVLRRLLKSVGPLQPLDILRLVDLATKEVGSAGGHTAQAGIAHVINPGAVVAEVDRLLWWASPETVRTTPRLTNAEREALRVHGVVLPDAKMLARRRAAASARALAAPAMSLLIIAPKVDAQGNGVSRPAIVDEVLPHADLSRSRALLEAQRGVRPVLRSHGQPRATWTAPAGRLALRAVESPNSVAVMLGCSLRWALRYSTAVSATADGGLPGGPLLFGRLAHELLHSVLEKHSDASADDLAADIGRLFDLDAPKLAATLFVPGADADRAAVRAIVVDAARLVGHLMEDLGLRVESTEEPFTDESGWLGARFEGRPDLVLGPSPRMVLDFKWSLGRHRDAVRAGTAHQLASYSFLVGGGAATVGVGYLVLRLRQVFTTTKLTARGTRLLEGPNPAVTFAALQRSVALVTTKLLAGSLEAPGANGGDADPDRLDEGGHIVVAPPCTFCEYSVLCGRDLGDGR